MGIRGLLTYVKTASDLVTESVDLVEVAKSKTKVNSDQNDPTSSTTDLTSTIELLCDFYSFELYILDNFYKAIVKDTGNRFIRHMGGEYKTLNKYIETFVQQLKALGIVLVMYVDATHGIDKDTTEKKFSVWKQRHFHGISIINKIFECVAGLKNIYDLGDEDKIRPICLEIQFQQTLKDNCNVEFIYSIDSEINALIANHLQTRPNAYAVLANDSDFCIFKNCKFIPYDFFDTDHDMEMGYSKLPCKPLKLQCRVVTANKLAKCLQLPHADNLVYLAMLLPSNFMATHHSTIKQVLNLPEGCSLLQAAAHIRFYGNPLTNKSVLAKTSQDNELKQAVDKTILFYTLGPFMKSSNNEREQEKSTEVKKIETDNDKGIDENIDKILCERVLAGDIDSNLLAMRRGYFWYRLILEDNSKGSPVCEDALSELRQILYGMILSDDSVRVKEFGRSPTDFFLMRLRIRCERENVPLIVDIKNNPIFKNLKIFHTIITHQEPTHLAINFFDKFGRKFGFICYVLRYFLFVNYQNNLNISLEEFLACASMTFNGICFDEDLYRSYKIMPSVRCITVGNWFQAIYRYTYRLVAKTLYLDKEFPAPSQFFSGSGFSALYGYATSHATPLIKHLSPDEYRSLEGAFKTALQDKKDIMNAVCRNIVQIEEWVWNDLATITDLPNMSGGDNQHVSF